MTGITTPLIIYEEPNKNKRVYDKWEPAVTNEHKYILSHDPASDDDWNVILATKVKEVSDEWVGEWDKNMNIPKVYPEDWDFYHPKKKNDDRKD